MTDFALKLEGVREQELKEWERIRVLAFITAKPYLKNKNMTIEKFLPLASDKKEKSTGPTREGMQAMKERLALLQKANLTKKE